MNMLFLIVRYLISIVVVLTATSVAAIENEGFIEPWRQVNAAVPESGVISNITVKEGENVKKDQLLLRLDSQVLDASLKIAEARANSNGEKRSAQALYKMRDQRYKKLKSLKASGHARVNELTKANAERAVSLANITMAKDNEVINKLEVDRIKAQIERRSIRSPFDGVVTRIHKEISETVNGTETTVLTIAQLSPLKLVIHIPTEQALKLKINDSVPVFLPDQQQQINAKVDFVSPVTDADSGTVRIKLRIPNKNNKVRSGIRAIANLQPKSLVTAEEIIKHE